MDGRQLPLRPQYPHQDVKGALEVSEDLLDKPSPLSSIAHSFSKVPEGAEEEGDLKNEVFSYEPWKQEGKEIQTNGIRAKKSSPTPRSASNVSLTFFLLQKARQKSLTQLNLNSFDLGGTDAARATIWEGGHDFMPLVYRPVPRTTR